MHGVDERDKERRPARVTFVGESARARDRQHPRHEQKHEHAAREVDRDVDDVVAGQVEAAQRVIQGQSERQKRAVLADLVERRLRYTPAPRYGARIREVPQDRRHPPDLGIVPDPIQVVEMELVHERVRVRGRDGESQHEDRKRIRPSAARRSAAFVPLARAHPISSALVIRKEKGQRVAPAPSENPFSIVRSTSCCRAPRPSARRCRRPPGST